MLNLFVFITDTTTIVIIGKCNFNYNDINIQLLKQYERWMTSKVANACDWWHLQVAKFIKSRQLQNIIYAWKEPMGPHSLIYPAHYTLRKNGWLSPITTPN